ncbi:MAG: hypothetical protein ACOVN4_09130 [Bosea sp. (in: a-proteobacteria)]|jgi:hypothetical protein
MNKIVREHYPVSALPDDLRRSLPDVVTAKVVIEPDSADEKPFIPSEWGDELARMAAARAGSINSGYADGIRRLRELRDEWDD